MKTMCQMATPIAPVENITIAAAMGGARPAVIAIEPSKG
jgi:hypothetical protein